MPRYQLFSLPNCDRCHQTKDFLKQISILYEELNLGMPSGKKEWGKVLMGGYTPVQDDHGYVMPILVRRGPDGIEGVFQGPDSIQASFEDGA